MTFDFAAARDIMVDSQVRPNDVPDLAIQQAMRSIAREGFCPPAKAQLAYADAELEYAPGRVLLRPRHLAKLVHATAPRRGERALAIAAPYAAAVLEHIGLAVTRLDGEDLKTPPAGAFDVIVCEGAVSEPPAAWLAALAEGGRMGVIVRAGPAGKMRLYLRAGADVGYRTVFDATPPVLPGFALQPGFVF
ncbi:MAG TPA: protein-L-isoaspartate O-methyltransferase [Caulobacteraceae bacterium]|jgi:protein-L-isoaspartate(D-aspartate) O-methyltransferase|nr:protein-L-isoaspartate O-methyltransferase [Caulobacteraceae bacterium]